jgi:hypothetical protein
VITALLFLIILNVDTLASFFFLIVLAQVLIILVLVVRLKAAFRLEVLLPASGVAPLRTEPSPRLAHLIEQVVSPARLALAPRLWVIVIVEYLLILRSLLIQLQVFNYFLVFLLSLHLLQVVFIELIL